MDGEKVESPFKKLMTEQDLNGNTQIHRLIIDENLEALNDFLAFDCYTEEYAEVVNNQGLTALHLAFFTANPDIRAALRAKLPFFKNALKVQDASERTILHRAAALANINQLSVLLAADECSADVLSIPDHQGNTALHLAVISENSEAVRTILASNACTPALIAALNREEKSALDLATTQEIRGYLNNPMSCVLDVAQARIASAPPLTREVARDFLREAEKLRTEELTPDEYERIKAVVNETTESTIRGKATPRLEPVLIEAEKIRKRRVRPLVALGLAVLAILLLIAALLVTCIALTMIGVPIPLLAPLGIVVGEQIILGCMGLGSIAPGLFGGAAYCGLFSYRNAKGKVPPPVNTKARPQFA